MIGWHFFTENWPARQARASGCLVLLAALAGATADAASARTLGPLIQVGSPRLAELPAPHVVLGTFEHLHRVQGRTATASIEVGRMIFAEPGSQTPLAIQIGQSEFLPRNSFVRLRGLPTTAALSEGHVIAPGAWAIPIAALHALKINVPSNAKGRSEITITLVAVDGTVLTEARTLLVIDTGAQMGVSAPALVDVPTIASLTPVPTSPKAGRTEPSAAPPPKSSAAQPSVAAPSPAAPSPAAPSPPPNAAQTAPQRADEETLKARRYLARGREKFAEGDVATGQLFFQRAAEAGLAEGALALGETYDVAELRKRGHTNSPGDPAAARRWYEKAKALGSPEAEARLQRLIGSR